MEGRDRLREEALRDLASIKKGGFCYYLVRVALFPLACVVVGYGMLQGHLDWLRAKLAE